MGKSNVTGVWKDLHGRVGDVVFRRTVHGLVLADLPHRNLDRVPSESEVDYRRRFLAAVKAAQVLLADPVHRPFYDELARKRQVSAYALAMGDALKKPEVKAIDLSGYHGQIGEVISVIAVDNVEVTGVTVTIRSQTGAVLESGPATVVIDHWEYKATTALPAGDTPTIEVTATDRPGNTSTRTQQP